MPASGIVRYAQIRGVDRKGSGAQVQMFGGGATVNGNVAKYNASGDLIDGGAPVGGTGLMSWVTLTAPVDGDFSWINQGGASIVSSSNPTRLFLNAPAGTGQNLRCRVKAAPATPYTITAWFFPLLSATGGGGSFSNCGLLWREVATGEIVNFRLYYDGTTDKVVMSVAKYDSPTVANSEYLNKNIEVLSGSAGICWRIEDDGTNRKCYHSTDGENFMLFHSIGRTDFLTADQVGYFANAWSATEPTGILLASWKQA